MLTLHHATNTRSGRIVWLLEELALPYTLNRLEFHPSALKSDAHRERHPLGRVPVLEDDDVVLFESGAIVEYILDKHAPGRLRPAVDAPMFAQYLQWFHYCEGMVMPPINTIVVQTVLLPPERRNKDALDQAMRLLGKTLRPIDTALAGREYLAGAFSAADIMLGHACYMAGRRGCISDDMPALAAYVERVKARPAFQTGIAA